jgi:hypothetical protein
LSQRQYTPPRCFSIPRSGSIIFFRTDLKSGIRRLLMLLIRSGRRNTRTSLMNHSLLLLLLISIRVIHPRRRG